MHMAHLVEVSQFSFLSRCICPTLRSVGDDTSPQGNLQHFGLEQDVLAAFSSFDVSMLCAWLNSFTTWPALLPEILCLRAI